MYISDLAFHDEAGNIIFDVDPLCIQSSQSQDNIIDVKSAKYPTVFASKYIDSMESITTKRENCIRVVEKLSMQNDNVFANLFNQFDKKILQEMYTILDTNFGNLLSNLERYYKCELTEFQALELKPQSKEPFFVREICFKLVRLNKKLSTLFVQHLQGETRVEFLDHLYWVVVNCARFHDTLVKYFNT